MRRWERFGIRKIRKDHDVTKEDISRFPDKARRYILSLESELNEANEVAAFNKLTGLPRREIFEYQVKNHMSELEREVEEIEKKPKERIYSGMSFVYIDTHNFKYLNDRLGDFGGDKALQAVAEKLKESIRKGDEKARWGGDEFATLLKVRGNSRSQVLENLYKATVSLPIKAGVIPVEYGFEVPIEFKHVNLDMGATVMDNSFVAEKLKDLEREELLGELHKYSGAAMKISKKNAGRYRSKKFICFWNPGMSEGDMVSYIQRAFARNDVERMDLSLVSKDGKEYLLCAW